MSLGLTTAWCAKSEGARTRKLATRSMGARCSTLATPRPVAGTLVVVPATTRDTADPLGAATSAVAEPRPAACTPPKLAAPSSPSRPPTVPWNDHGREYRWKLAENANDVNACLKLGYVVAAPWKEAFWMRY